VDDVLEERRAQRHAQRWGALSPHYHQSHGGDPE
jgi:hypothetical protein